MYSVTAVTITVPPVPENFTAVSAAMTIQFSWSSALPPRFTAEYTLTCLSLVVGVDPVTMTYAEAGTYNLEGFRPATDYRCSVFASNDDGKSPLSYINVTTVDESEFCMITLEKRDFRYC